MSTKKRKVVKDKTTASASAHSTSTPGAVAVPVFSPPREIFSPDKDENRAPIDGDELRKRAELVHKELGLVLPEPYLALLRVHNGCSLRKKYIRVPGERAEKILPLSAFIESNTTTTTAAASSTTTSSSAAAPIPPGEEAYASVGEILGVGVDKSTKKKKSKRSSDEDSDDDDESEEEASSNSLLDNKDAYEEWGITKDFLLLCGDGHEWLALDYRADPHNPAAVALSQIEYEEVKPDVDTAGDFEVHRLAPDFQSFLTHLEYLQEDEILFGIREPKETDFKVLAKQVSTAFGFKWKGEKEAGEDAEVEEEEDDHSKESEKFVLGGEGGLKTTVKLQKGKKDQLVEHPECHWVLHVDFVPDAQESESEPEPDSDSDDSSDSDSDGNMSEGSKAIKKEANKVKREEKKRKHEAAKAKREEARKQKEEAKKKKEAEDLAKGIKKRAPMQWPEVVDVVTQRLPSAVLIAPPISTDQIKYSLGS